VDEGFSPSEASSRVVCARGCGPQEICGKRVVVVKGTWQAEMITAVQQPELNRSRRARGVREMILSVRITTGYQRDFASRADTVRSRSPKIKMYLLIMAASQPVPATLKQSPQ